jgi:hypothetical protein
MKSLKLAAAWILVALPLVWGLYHSVKKSLPLFDGVAPVGSLQTTPR